MYQSDVQSGADKHVVENTPGLAFRLHPLELSQHITLTPLQSAITTAILRCGEPSCHITTIYEFVARRWHKIRGKDGTNYATDYRKAVQTCLRHHANNIALFRVDPNDTKRWMLCATLSESEEAIVRFFLVLFRGSFCVKHDAEKISLLAFSSLSAKNKNEGRAVALSLETPIPQK
jgi:hypothetical protein